MDSTKLNADLSGAIGGGTFNLGGNSRSTATQGGAINGAVLNLSGTAQLQATTDPSAINNTTFSLADTSKVYIKANDAIANSSFTLNGNSVIEAEKSLKANLLELNDTSTLYLHGNAGTYTATSLTGNGGRIVNADNANIAGLSLLGDGTDRTYSWTGTFDGNALEMTVMFKRGIWNFTGGSNDTTTLILEDKAQFTGYGTHGSMSALAGSTIAPGFNTLSVNNLDFEDGARYVVSARDDGTASKLEVRGQLELQVPLTIHVEAQAGAWSTEQSYDIITWGSKTGAYFSNSNVTANFAYLTPTVTEHSSRKKLELKLVRNSNSDGTFASQAQTANQRAVANAVEALPNGHAVYNYVETLPAGAPPAAFNSLSGEAHASLLSGLPNLSSHAYRLPMANLRNTLNAGLNPAAVTAQVGGVQGSTGLPAYGDKPAWVQLVGNWQRYDGNANAGTLDQDMAGVFAGYDNEISDGWYLGGALGYVQTDAEIGSRDSEADIRSYSATLYGGKAFALDTERQLNVLAGLSYTYHDIDSERKVRGLGQKLDAGYAAHTTQVFGEVGYLIGKPDGRFVEPFAGLAVSHLEVESFKEKGGSAALRGKADSDTQVISSLGVRGQLPYELGNFGAVVRGSLAWEHAFGDEHMDATLRFVDGSHNFKVRGVNLDRDTAVVGLGTQVNVTPSAAVALDYEGRFANGVRDHGASLKVQWDF